MQNRLESLLNRRQIDALLAARHDDVFSVLGMHEHSGGHGLIARALLPGASAVDVIANKDNKKVASLELIDEAGLFEGSLGRRRKPFSYRLRIRYGDDLVEREDPYRFSSLLKDDDLYLFGEGTQEKVYQWMGAHGRQVEGVDGTLFVVWAPGAERVSVVGEFNAWDGRRHCMRKHPASGIWEIFIPAVGEGLTYKYEIVASGGEVLPLKADPYAFAMQHPPETASKTVSAQSYVWQDEQWMSSRASSSNLYHGPVSIYEVHLGSWRRIPERSEGFLTYRELAAQLVPYAVDMGFTHIQLMPVSEYPFGGSWGYQPVGLYAPTSRFGSPDDFRFFVDSCHKQGIGVLLDWVPGHFPTDEHGIGRFDGSCLYEHEDVRKGFHPDWNTLIYDYGRGEVVSYLLSNAIYWLDQFHIDGLRVDAVASMLYLDYSREEGEWLPNVQGGRENLEAVELLQKVNSRVYLNNPGAMMVAEESTTWPGVSRAVDEGGLGFGFKWNMGWMNDTLRYMERDPIHRQHHHGEMTFGLVYGFSENFVLPLSHDEVVHGKGSLLNKMPGDDWQKFANLRAYLGFMWTHPGKKLLFMGGEFAQVREWNHDLSLDWQLLEDAGHQGVQNLVRDLNKLYRELPALHQLDCDSKGFEWVQADNQRQSILVYLRKGLADTPPVLVVVNLTPTSYPDYRLGVPRQGHYRECLNTDSEHYGGSNMGNVGRLQARAKPLGGQAFQLSLCVPPLATLIFEWQAG
ncbi:MAG: 1,4-alpha-glucan branching protein GlgB [Gammaproteobacteria bacterium]|nr:1,4-alpha-glucan branching protein GlgB [Gammaproteobacteria bacterium]